MSFTTPSVDEINSNIIAQLESSMARTVPLLPRSFLRVLAKTLAAVVSVLYRYAGFIALQMFVSSASFKATVINGKTVVPLVEWGRLIGIGDPKTSTQAELTIQLTVQSQGGSLPVNSQLLNSATGVTYLTLSGVLLNSNTVEVGVRAVSDQTDTQGAGVQGNMEAGDKLSFVNPQASVAQVAVVVSQDVTGASAETEQAYRQRIVERFRRRPQGGAYSDYEQWGESVAGIVNVYPYTGDFPGQVDLYVEATEDSSGSPDGIPTNAQLTQVLAAVELDDNGLATRRPVGALVNAFPISRKEFNISIFGLVVSDAVTVQSQIDAAIAEYLLERSPYVIGLDSSFRKDRISASALGGLIDSIVTPAGGIFTRVTLTAGGVSTEVYTLNQGEKAKLGVVSYV